MNYENSFDGNRVSIDGAAVIAAAAARYEQAVRLMHQDYWRRHAYVRQLTEVVSDDPSGETAMAK